MKLTFDVPEGLAEKISEEIKVALEEYRKKQVWPQDGDTYYYVSACGETNDTPFTASAFDKGCLSHGNCFKTREEAEFKLEQLKVFHELEQLADDDQIDEFVKTHYLLMYDFDDMNIKVDWIACGGFMYGTHYFKSKESAQAAIDKIGEDRLKKYYFCMPEVKE